MNLFYCHIQNGHHVLFSEEESRHILLSLRKKSGDTIYATEGKGVIYKVQIQNQNKYVTGLVVSSLEVKKNTPHVELLVGNIKQSERMEWLVEKAVELGVHAIVPFTSERTEKSKLNLERLQRISIAAMKQSLCAFLPEIKNITPLKYLINEPFDGGKFMATCTREEKSHLVECAREHTSIRILIGPEGDFSLDELEMASENHWKLVSLGSSRLRSETAALFALSCILVSRPILSKSIVIQPF